jgi:hypothetical protein
LVKIAGLFFRLGKIFRKLALLWLYFFKKKIQINKKVYSTWGSKAVAQPSTSQARRGLTSVIGREPVLSAWCGRRPKCVVANSLIYFKIIAKNSKNDAIY